MTAGRLRQVTGKPTFFLIRRLRGRILSGVSMTTMSEGRHERELLESRRVRNQEVTARAAERVAEIERARSTSDEAVERAVRRLREVGVIR